MKSKLVATILGSTLAIGGYFHAKDVGRDVGRREGIAYAAQFLGELAQANYNAAGTLAGIDHIQLNSSSLEDIQQFGYEISNSNSNNLANEAHVIGRSQETLSDYLYQGANSEELSELLFLPAREN